MKTTSLIRTLGLASAFSALAAQADPQLDAWQTKLSGQYARVVEKTGGSKVSTWPSAGLTDHGGGQSKPAYSDVQQIDYSSLFVYIHGTGLASHQMGPWYISANVIFGNWPSNQKYIRRFPRNPEVADTKTTNGGGALGCWVNGVALFNLLDMYSYKNSTGQDAQQGPDGGGDGIWMRNAVYAESATFDASNAHQPPSGEYHYHDNPLALRYQLDDHVTYDSSANVYSEAATSPKHSPILGYAYDGYPIYGPYGYATANNSSSAVRRMVSGFVIRDGSHGTTNLATTGRTTLAAWSAALHGISATLSSGQYGPAVSTAAPVGKYVEDYDYLGSHGYTQGVDFDLDLYNGRNCVTPEYPNGTYAYFTTLDASSAAAFPYVIGRQYYGTVSGGQVGSISESVTTYKLGGAKTPVTLKARRSGQREKLTWTSVEGGKYRVRAKTSGVWDILQRKYASNGLSTIYRAALRSHDDKRYKKYHVNLSGIADYDPGS